MKSGFTLIEVMIVVLIGGLLMAGAFAGFRYVQRAKENNTKIALAKLDSTLETYNTSIGEYPNDLQELIDGPRNPNLSRKFGEAMAIPADLKDSWGKEFEYSLKPKGSRPPYELYSTGSKGDAKIYSPVSAE